MPDLRKLSSRGRRGRVPRPVPPTGIQLRYLAALRAMVAYAHGLVKDRLVSQLPELLARLDHADAQHPAKRVNTLIEGAARSFAKKFPQDKLEALSEGIAKATSEHQKTQLFRQVKALVGVDLKTMATPKLTSAIKQFTAENVALIRSIPREYFGQVERVVLAGMKAGTRHENIAEDVEERFEVAQSRAKLIARDQVSKAVGDLNRVRQQALGISKFIWRSVEDERVRDAHDDFDGNTYDWDDPPGDGSPEEGTYPGTAINCRCFSEPVVDDILAAIDQE